MYVNQFSAFIKTRFRSRHALCSGLFGAVMRSPSDPAVFLQHHNRALKAVATWALAQVRNSWLSAESNVTFFKSCRSRPRCTACPLAIHLCYIVYLESFRLMHGNVCLMNTHFSCVYTMKNRLKCIERNVRREEKLLMLRERSRAFMQMLSSAHVMWKFFGTILSLYCELA